MPPKFSFGSSPLRNKGAVYVSPLTRLRAWLMGYDHVELLARYGERTVAQALWMQWKGTLLACCWCATMLISYTQTAHAGQALDNVEQNRRRYYGREFTPAYTKDAPLAVYDGARGYVSGDATSGLLVNADRQIVSVGTAEERKDRLARAEISAEMVAEAQKLLHSPRYHRQE